MRWKVVFILLVFLSCGDRSVIRTSGLPATGPERGEVWSATYLAGTKIGYGVTRYERTSDGFIFDNMTKMTVGMLGKRQTVNVHSRVRTASNLAMRSFEFKLSSPDGSFSARGEVTGNRLVFETSNGRREIWLARDLYPIEAIGMVVRRTAPAPRMRLNYLVFDGAVLDTMSTEVEVLGPETVELGTYKLPALKLRLTRAKFDVTVWVDEYGATLKEHSPLGISSLRVTREQALAGEVVYPPDLMRIFAVPVDTVIPEGRRWRRVLMAVSGVDTVLLKTVNDNQRIVAFEGSEYRLEIMVPEPDSGVRLPVTKYREFLSPTVTIQSTAPEIIETAREIIGGVEDAAVAARRITDWVFRSLHKEAVASLPNATDVLKSRKGDCNEHAVLFAALARAAGIPTKVAVGLVYMRGGFYYHAWNEVYLGMWVPVDATFGEFPASALRLKLAEGELSQQAQVLSAVSRIKIRVLEFE